MDVLLKKKKKTIYNNNIYIKYKYKHHVSFWTHLVWSHRFAPSSLAPSFWTRCLAPSQPGFWGTVSFRSGQRPKAGGWTPKDTGWGEPPVQVNSMAQPTAWAVSSRLPCPTESPGSSVPKKNMCRALRSNSSVPSVPTHMAPLRGIGDVPLLGGWVDAEARKPEHA